MSWICWTGLLTGCPARLFWSPPTTPAQSCSPSTTTSSGYLFPDPPADLPRRAAGKASLAEICRAAGVPHPATTVPADAAEATAFAESYGYPVMAKVNRFWAADKTTNVQSTSIVRSRAALLALVEQVRRASAAARTPACCSRNTSPRRRTADARIGSSTATSTQTRAACLATPGSRQTAFGG